MVRPGSCGGANLPADAPKANPWLKRSDASGAATVGTGPSPGAAHGSSQPKAAPVAATERPSSSLVQGEEDWPSLGPAQAPATQAVASEEDSDSAKENRGGAASSTPDSSARNTPRSGARRGARQRWVPLDIEAPPKPKPTHRSTRAPAAASETLEGGGDRRGRSFRGRQRGRRPPGWVTGHPRPPGRGGPGGDEEEGFSPASFLGTYYFNQGYMRVDEVTLREYVRKQVEYYFSEENLQRDFFLRRKMDAQGYLPLSLIASFHRIQALTQDVGLVLEAVRESPLLELREEVKVRTVRDPLRWPLPQAPPLHPDVPAFVPGQPYPPAASGDDADTEEPPPADGGWKEVRRRSRGQRTRASSHPSVAPDREELSSSLTRSCSGPPTAATTPSRTGPTTRTTSSVTPR